MMKIARESSNDISLLCEIFNYARSKANCYPNDLMSEAEFKNLITGEDIYSYRSEGIIAGFVGVYVPSKFIHHLYISPMFQRCGIGITLLQYCLDKYGAPMTLKCDDCNAPAQEFYKACGLSVLSHGNGDYGPWTEFKLERFLKSPSGR